MLGQTGLPYIVWTDIIIDKVWRPVSQLKVYSDSLK